jgi:hypothetical protein
MATLKLMGWGLRPWLEFDLDPHAGSYAKRRLREAPMRAAGYAGRAQELSVPGQGMVLCAVYVFEGDMHLRLGAARWSLFQPGLLIEHRQPGVWSCELQVTEPGGKSLAWRYRRKDFLAFLLDGAYDELDFELAHLPAALPGLARRKREELIGEWTAQAAARPGS